MSRFLHRILRSASAESVDAARRLRLYSGPSANFPHTGRHSHRKLALTTSFFRGNSHSPLQYFARQPERCGV